MQMVGCFAEFERAMIRERTSAGLAVARAEGRVGDRPKKLDATKRREIVESVITDRKTGTEMARLYNVSQPIMSRMSHNIEQSFDTVSNMDRQRRYCKIIRITSPSGGKPATPRERLGLIFSDKSSKYGMCRRARSITSAVLDGLRMNAT